MSVAIDDPETENETDIEQERHLWFSIASIKSHSFVFVFIFYMQTYIKRITASHNTLVHWFWTHYLFCLLKTHLKNEKQN